MPEVLAPSPSSLSLSLENPTAIRRVSTNSLPGLTSVIASAASSVTSISYPGDVEVVKEEGLRHASFTLEARHYKKLSFLNDLLACIRTLHVPSWGSSKISAQDITVKKVSGSMTNAVFFVSCKETPTLLLRIYGPSSGNLISRPRELHTLHILSSRYGLGPQVYGTFENGRLEEYFPSEVLTAQDMRNPEISRWIGARMAELHSVDIEVIEETSPKTRGEGKGWQLGVKKNVKSWLQPAREVLELPKVPQSVRDEFNIDGLEQEWKTYLAWLSTVDDVQHGSRRVFAHNDTQYGNLLRMKAKENVASHRQIIVVDFEYASANPASFDIANHFHEWTYNYHTSTPHIPDSTRYPSLQERENFYLSYLTHADKVSESLTAQAKNLEAQVQCWSPACHAMWALWGLVQARADLEAEIAEPEFDYIGYALHRVAVFRHDIKGLGII